jgi:hypothetical protein
MLKRKFKSGDGKAIINAISDGGLIRSSDEVSVMEMEQRNQLVQV